MANENMIFYWKMTLRPEIYSMFFENNAWGEPVVVESDDEISCLEYEGKNYVTIFPNNYEDKCLVVFGLGSMIMDGKVLYEAENNGYRIHQKFLI